MNKIEFNILIICELVFGVIKDWNDKKIKKHGYTRAFAVAATY